jgi:hypothetical protein
MKSRIRIAGASVMVAAGLMVAVAAPASASPPLTFPQLDAICTAQGGTFEIHGPQGIVTCVTATGDFPEGPLNGARAVCEKAYVGATFSPPGAAGPFTWACGAPLTP